MTKQKIWRSNRWSARERKTALEILEKIAYCQDVGMDLPGEVFEAHIRSKKNISTEMVVFDAKGRVYLIERPSLEENPCESFPGQLNSPGVTHIKNELLEDTFRRLEKREFGGVPLQGIQEVGNLETKVAPRGMYLLRIFMATVAGELVNAKGRFYEVNEIPWERLVNCHRKIILPLALSARNT